MAVILLPFNTISAQNETQATIHFDQPSYATEKMSCYYYDTGKMLSRGQAPQKATVTVSDPSANKFSASIDRVTVFVWSDSDRKGMEITAYETEVDSGVFKGTVTISDGPSTQGVIHVDYGNTLTARYAGATPWSSNASNHGITTTAFIGISCPPLERVPASGINVTDNKGNKQKTMLVNKQIQIGSKLDNVTIRNQTFAYIVQILDENNSAVSLSSVSGLLLPSQTFSPSVSWTPAKAGIYTVQVFVWQNIHNPNSLSAPLSTSLTVLPSLPTYGSSATSVENIRCHLGYEPVTWPSKNSTACVTAQTSANLVERGWARLAAVQSSDDARINANGGRPLDITMHVQEMDIGGKTILAPDLPIRLKGGENVTLKIGIASKVPEPLSLQLRAFNNVGIYPVLALSWAKFNGDVSGLPSGFAASFGKDKVTVDARGSDQEALNLAADKTVKAGSYQIGVLGLVTIAGPDGAEIGTSHNLLIPVEIRQNENPASDFTINSGGGSTYLSPTCPICTPEYFNETNTYSGNVGKIIPGYPILVKISDPYTLSPRTDQIPARDILPDGTFHYTVHVTGKFGQNQYTLNFIYGNKNITERLPVLPP